MNNRIHALPLQLANQIAAGEVVERPASVLKELVENSIDAGATQIDIQIEGAGRQLIKVSDNGGGIHPDDLPLALSRHATSKINSSEQLSHIGSLGFRGEALPSIASVSRLTLASKQADQDCGWQLVSESEQPEPAAHPDGTSVSVAELFFNLPARRRFLRSDKTELQHLITTFNRLALSRFDIGFNGRFSDSHWLKLPALKDPAQHAQRISKICGQAFTRNASYLDQQFEDIRLHGWVGKRSAHRAQTDVQYFFINGRVIRDRIINHAVRQAYGDTLPTGRQPAYVLYLTLPLDRVDVNVHPTKHEVRFRDARLIHGLITRAVTEALDNEPAVPNIQDELPLAKVPEQVEERASNYQTQSVSKPLDVPQPAPVYRRPDEVLILHQRFGLIYSEEPQLIDLQAADRALRQAQFVRAVEQGDLTSRPILVPMRLTLPSADLALLDQHQALLAQLALILEINADTVAIKRIPYLLSQVDLQQLAETVVNSLEKHGNDRAAMITTLSELIPLSPLTSQEQARQIIDALQHAPETMARWQQKLDPATLTGLFSN
ncbi:MAG: DNA mismatch repair endonuclease MutL [Pseudomonadota bacterium]|nr:DNA mismatch repair endonuclease MutL [Pseudomonadota bacterium]